MNDLVNYFEIIKRIKEIEGLRHNKDVAALWNLSENDFSNRKRRGTLLGLLVSYGIKKGLSLDLFLTGKNITPINAGSVVEASAEYGAAFMCGWTPEIREACRTVKKILESGDKKTADALRQNIEAFETSVTRRNENEKLREEKRIKTLNQSTGTD